MAGITSLGAALQSTVHRSKGQVMLQELVEPDDSPLTALAFQYFPESISDQKSVNWRSSEVPGGSLPIKQFVSGGDRTISFTAFFSTDVNLTDGTMDPDPVKLVAAAATMKQVGIDDRNIDIRSAILWLRRFMYPRYDAKGGSSSGGAPVTYAPRKLRLIIPNSGIGLAGCGAIGPHAILCCMTQCEVTWMSYFPNNMPRLAKVQLGFSELAQSGGSVTFPSPTPDMDTAAGGYEDGVSVLVNTATPSSIGGLSGGRILSYSISQTPKK